MRSETRVLNGRLDSAVPTKSPPRAIYSFPLGELLRGRVSWEDFRDILSDLRRESYSLRDFLFFDLGSERVYPPENLNYTNLKIQTGPENWIIPTVPLEVPEGFVGKRVSLTTRAKPEYLGLFRRMEFSLQDEDGNRVEGGYRLPLGIRFLEVFA